MNATRINWHSTRRYDRADALRSARTLTRTLVVAPVLATIVIASSSLASAHRATEDTYDFPGSGHALNVRYDQYLPVMRLSHLAWEQNTLLPLPYARDVAAKWWAGEQGGRLLPLPQSRYGESVFEGVTGQILRASERISATLTDSAVELSWSGHPGEAAFDALRSMEVARALRYSDEVTCSLADANLRRNLDIIKRVAPKLNAGQRTTLSKTLQAIRVDGPHLGSMLNGMYGLYEQDQTQDHIPADELPQLSALRRVGDGLTTLAALDDVRDRIAKVNPKWQPTAFLAMIRRTIQSEIATEQHWEKAESALGA